MGGTRSHSEKKFIGKSSQNSPIPVLIFCSSITCVFCLYIGPTLLKVFNYYDLSVLSMRVMVSKKSLDSGVVVRGELYPVLFWIFGICLTFQSPLTFS